MANRSTFSPRVYAEIGRRVRQTGSLISPGSRIRDQRSEGWAASIENRVIFWRVDNPWLPDVRCSDDEILFLTIHEASHLEYTGAHDVPIDIKMKQGEKTLFRFVNWLEDIRIDRFAFEKYGRLRPIAIEFNDKCFDWQESTIEGTSKMDIVCMNWMCIEDGRPTFGPQEYQDYAKNTWPVIDRICKARSTEQLARRGMPFFRELWDPSQEALDNPDKSQAVSLVMGMLDGDFDQGEPFRSHIDGVKPDDQQLSVKEKLQGLAKDATTEKAKRAFEGKAINEDAKQNRERHKIREEQGTDVKDARGGNDAWRQSVIKNRRLITSFTRIIQTILKHNADDEWETGLRRGQLDKSALPRTMRGDMRVHRDRHALGSHNYDWVILVDRSSSQSVRREPLLDATVILCEAIEKCGMGLGMVTWNHDVNHVKEFNTPLKGNAASILGRDIGSPQGSTYEAPALAIADRMLEARRNGAIQIVVSITDGQCPQGPTHSVQMIQALEAKGVTVMGVSIDYTTPRYYTNGTEIHGTQQLMTELPGLLRKVVKRA